MAAVVEAALGVPKAAAPAPGGLVGGLVGPQPVLAVAVTLKSLATSLKIPDDIPSALWGALGLDANDTSELEVAAAIPEVDLTADLTALRLEKKYNSGIAGRLSLLFARVRQEVAGPAPTVVALAAPVAAVAPPAAAPARMIRLQHVLDQASNEFCLPLTDELRADLRRNHYRIAGGDPPFGK